MSVRLLKDPATASSRVFVGHLQTDDMTKHELEEHFSKYGTVVGSLISRGFGFVQFGDEQSAQKAIQTENGAIFKGRRIDVRPAKKDSMVGNLGKPAVQQQFNSNHFAPGSDTFGSTGQTLGAPDPSQPLEPQGNEKGTDRFTEGNLPDQFANGNSSKGNNQFGSGSQNRGNAEQFAGGPTSQARTGSQFGQSGNQGRPNQNRNQNNQSNNQNQSTTAGRQRGKGGKRNKNRDSRDNSGANSFRDRSPLSRRSDEKSRDWEHKQGERPRGNNNFTRESFGDTTNRYEDFKTTGPRDAGMSFNTSSSEYSTTPAEKNDCEIIVVNKALTEYAEIIEMRLKKIGLTVDLLFPNEDVLLSRVLGNIASRGCLYAVVVTLTNQEHHSLTLNILHSVPQEHRNMPVEDAIKLISRDFSNYKARRRSVPANTPFANERHPDPIQVLLNMLADNHQLTVLQYDRVIKYLEIKREEQVQVELGGAKVLPPATLTVSDPKQAELQSRILNILNSNKTTTPAPSPVPAPVPPASWAPAASATATTTATTSNASGVSPSPLLNDPTVQKALDSLLQGNLLKSIGDQPATTATPLFAAFPNIGRF